MKRADIIAGLVLAAGFGACLWIASSFQYGTQFAPGPGFAPVWLSALGIVVSLAIAIHAVGAARAASARAQAQPLERRGLLRVAAVLVGLVVMLTLTEWLGLVSSILLLLLFMTLFVQRLSVVAALGASVGTTLFVYIVFVRLLDVPIPSGPLGF
ncbi:MAG TPA: tripartite tricarboxylate transporter TctB family protein [Burkholderiales bacterium]|nr:tripartite tricarboxylate transporter TctB family protein [Burkholderiales bacterium]